jgi:hypothetical protein
MPSSASTSIEVSVVMAMSRRVEATVVKYCPDEVLPRRGRIPPCLREDAVGEPERELDQALVAAAGELVEGVRALKEVAVAIEPLSECGSANVARHLLDERHKLNQSLTFCPGGSLAAPEPQPDCLRVRQRRSRDLRLAHRDTFQQSDQEVCRCHRRGDPEAVIGRPAGGGVEAADHEPRRIGVTPLPCLGDPDLCRRRRRARPRPFAGPLCVASPRA